MCCCLLCRNGSMRCQSPSFCMDLTTPHQHTFCSIFPEQVLLLLYLFVSNDVSHFCCLTFILSCKLCDHLFYMLFGRVILGFFPFIGTLPFYLHVCYFRYFCCDERDWISSLTTTLYYRLSHCLPSRVNVCLCLCFSSAVHVMFA